METEYLEIRPLMAEWLKDHAESRGLTLKELVAHILLSYREEWEESEISEEEEGTDDET